MDYDLVIVGGGLVGASLAVALRDAPLRIALLDARVPGLDDPRLFALNDSSCELMKNLKVWPALAPHAYPIHQVHVSHHGHFGAVRLNRQDVNLSALGHVVPAQHLEIIFNEQLHSQANLTMYQPAKLKKMTDEKGRVILQIDTLQGDIDLRASIVIGADGAESTVRTQLNIPSELIDYQQSAIVTRTTLRRGHQQIAYERFNAQGAIAMLPLGEHECATIWSGNHETIARLMLQKDDEFLQSLQSEFGYRLGRLQKIGKRSVFPLRMLKAKKLLAGNAFLLGNAAHTLHPIAAQGFNLALYEVAVLAEAILLQLNNHHVLTAADLFQMSEKTKKQRALSLTVSHQLVTLFSKQSILLNVVIQIGMMGLDIATPIKTTFIQRTMGRKGNVPRLLLASE